ncbi:hypothetical protein AMECASPLE_026715 [Ameca splendens]|uniref:Uncharacterized protein n=1 Tax=Ameca splendens TaxID=208324 RepID=A0ABV0XHY5_9TELE
MAAGHTLLVMDGASPFGLMCIQLACYHGVKVLTTSPSPQKQTFLEQLRPSVGLYSPALSRLHIMSLNAASSSYTQLLFSLPSLSYLLPLLPSSPSYVPQAFRIL